MRIAGTHLLVPLLQTDSPAYPELLAWNSELLHNDWENMIALQRDYPQARKAGRSRVKFEFSGGVVILIQYNFTAGRARIHFAGTAAEFARFNRDKAHL